MEREQKITFLLNKIKESYRKINLIDGVDINIDSVLYYFELRYKTLEDRHLDNIIKSNGFSFYTTKQYKAA